MQSIEVATYDVLEKIVNEKLLKSFCNDNDFRFSFLTICQKEYVSYFAEQVIEHKEFMPLIESIIRFYPLTKDLLVSVINQLESKQDILLSIKGQLNKDCAEKYSFLQSLDDSFRVQVQNHKKLHDGINEFITNNECNVIKEEINKQNKKKSALEMEIEHLKSSCDVKNLEKTSIELNNKKSLLELNKNTIEELNRKIELSSSFDVELLIADLKTFFNSKNK